MQPVSRHHVQDLFTQRPDSLEIPAHYGRRIICWLLFALLGLSGCIQANESLVQAARLAAASAPENCASPPASAPARNVSRPGYTRLPIIVHDSAGHPVSGIKKEDVDLTIGGQNVRVSSLEYVVDLPQSVGFVVDASGSMKPKMAQMQLAVSEIVKRLNPQDDLLIVGVAKEPYLLQTGTTDHALIVERADALEAWGQTDLYDGILSGIDSLARLCFPRKTLVVISDGIDNVSTSRNSDVINAAKAAGIQINAIGIGEIVAQGPSSTLIVWPWNPPDLQRVDLHSLEMITGPTGGQLFHLETSDDEKEVTLAASKIAEGSGEYLLEFASPAGAAPIPVSVAVKTHPNYTVVIK